MMIDTLTITSTNVNMFFDNVWHTGRVTSTEASTPPIERPTDSAIPKLPEVCCSPGAAPTLDEHDATELAGLLKAVADPVRLRLINIISQAGEACACDLPALLDRSQPTISHHLKILVEAGVLDREQRGKWAWFGVRNERLQALGDALRPGPDGRCC